MGAVPRKRRTTLERLFDKFNKLYFDGRLSPEYRVTWADPLKNEDAAENWGWQENSPPRIYLSTELRYYPEFRDMTLLHEMVHADGCDGHSADFQANMLRLAMAGAFNKIW
jgi:hypothetical protein